MTVAREEFDALVERVTALEAVTDRTWAMIGHLDVSVREVHEKLIQHDGRFDHLALKLDEVIRRLS